MADPAPSDAAAPVADPDASFSTFDQLRHLILAPEQERLGQIEHRLSDPKGHVRMVSQALPEAVIRCSAKDDRLARALAAMAETVVRFSVKKYPNPLASALYPLMGPAIRKSISETFRQMVQVLSLALENSLSIQGVQWRWEAIRTGRPFAEIVMMHSLVFRVEQVFLIHRETGLLMAHVATDETVEDNANIVSSMLTALQEFIRDSFRPGENSAIETVHMEDLSLLVEQTSVASLVGVVRGAPPADLRVLFQDTLEGIIRDGSSEIAAFDGDTAPFEILKHRLRLCLESRYKPRGKGKPFPFLRILGVGIILALATGVFFRVREERAWRAYVRHLGQEPGIVVVADHHPWIGRSAIRGLRDPLAPDPARIKETHGVDPATVIEQWVPFLSLDSRVILERARRVLDPPATVHLGLRDDGVLEITGSASHAWAIRARELAPGIPGVVSFVDRALQDADLAALDQAVRDLESRILQFSRDVELDPAMDAAFFNNLAGTIRLIVEKAHGTDQTARVIVTGHCDATGSVDFNTKLGIARAEKARALLVDLGVDPDRIRVEGEGVNRGKMGDGRRSVSFTVQLNHR